MPQINLTEDALRLFLKEAVAEALEERQDMFREIVSEVLEEAALAEAVREGQKTEAVTRDDVFALLQGSA